jgi:type II secretion system protein N
MRQFISRNKRWIGYISYCVILAIGFLYYLFPSDALRDYLQARASTLNTPLLVSIEYIKPWPPFGLRLGQAEVSLKHKPARKIFGAERLLIKPEPWSFFKGQSKYRFECLAYGGNVRGHIHFRKTSTSGPFDTEIELKNIRIGSYGYLKDLLGRHVDGILSGTICYSGEQGDLLGGNGEASLRLLDGRVELLLPVLSLESIDFNDVKMDMVLEKQKMNLTRLELEGPQMKSTLSGTVSLKKDFGKSMLDLKGRIEPFASLFKDASGLQNIVQLFKRGLRKGSLAFVIYGTISEPKIKFT